MLLIAELSVQGSKQTYYLASSASLLLSLPSVLSNLEMISMTFRIAGAKEKVAISARMLQDQIIFTFSQGREYATTSQPCP